jgi:hypothetical protein
VVIKSQSERCYGIPYILQHTEFTTNQIHYTLRVTIEAMVNAERPPLNMAFKSSTNNDIFTDFTFLLSTLKHRSLRSIPLPLSI